MVPSQQRHGVSRGRGLAAADVKSRMAATNVERLVHMQAVKLSASLRSAEGFHMQPVTLR